MAFRSNGPVTLTFPPFRGVTRRIILVAVVAFFAFAVFGVFAVEPAHTIAGHLVLRPAATFPREPWQLLTYAFFPVGLLSTLFAALTLWFFGSALEDQRGSRWFGEYFLVATIGGALLACLISFAVGSRAPELGPDNATAGLWPAVLAVMLAYARFNAETELSFNFLFRLKAKYLVAIYLLVYLALALVGGDRFGAMTAICSAAAGFLYLQFAPGRGLRFAASEGWFGIRNAFYRAKRRRAAKKFTVYMRKQGRDVSIDESGRYVDASGKPRNPNDRKWMN